MLTLCEADQVWQKFTEAWKHAFKMGLVGQFGRQLAYLDEYGGKASRLEDVIIVELGYDFAPYSFTVVWKRGEQPYMTGGLIYQGSEAPADGSFPSLTVSLNEGNGWFIHT